MTDLQKATLFFDGIKDHFYHPYKLLCYTENHDYDKCIIELRRESEEISNDASIRRAYNTTQTSATPHFARLAYHVWISLTKEQ